MLSEDLISELFPEEIPNHIFRFPFGVDSDDTFFENVSMIERAKNEYKLIVTTHRVIITNEVNDKIQVETVKLSAVQDFSFSTPGILSIGSITLKIDGGEISGSIDKNTNEGELRKAKEYVESTDMPPNGPIPDNHSDFGDVTDHAVIEDVIVVESYGYHVDDGSYDLEITSEGIKLEQKATIGTVSSYEISKEDILFEDISTTEKRNFTSENVSRYINQINPLLDDAAPTKKENKLLIKIPIYQGEGYITFQTQSKKDIRVILNSISKLDPQIRTEDESPGQKDSEETPMEILKRRLAEGEISPEEFEQRKEYLE